MTNNAFQNPGKERAVSFFRAGQLNPAKQECEACCKLHPEDPEIWGLLCEINTGLGLHEEAERCGLKAVSLAPENTRLRYSLAVALMYTRKTDRAIRLCQEIIDESPDSGMVWFLAGVCYRLQPGGGGASRALDCHEKALGLLPEPPTRLLAGLAVLYEQSGQLDKAREFALRTQETSAGVTNADVVLARLEKRSGDLEAARNRLEDIVGRSPASPLDNAVYSAVHNELGQVLDRLGEYDSAYQQFKQSQELAEKDESGRYKGGAVYDKIYRNRAVATTQNAAAWREETADDDIMAPVFLVGFPRSGTTLTERIITSHPGIVSSDEIELLAGVKQKLQLLTRSKLGFPYSLNELDKHQVTALRVEYWRLAQERCGIDAGGKYFLDKLPLNITDICLINRIFPEARILLLLRDPRDCCLSCFMQLFIPNDSMVNFYTLEGAARFYDATMKLWQHNEKTLDLNLHKLRYEDLVQDLEPQARSLFDFLGLEWDPQVLNYHENKTRIISTPSYLDASRPIYSRALYRWRNYASQITPVLHWLQPHIEAFGYDDI